MVEQPGAARWRFEGVERQMSCPRCEAEITHDRAFTPWCRTCEWNVDAGLEPRELPGRLGRTVERLHRTDGERLFQQLLAHADLRPRASAARLAANALALAVLAAWLLLVVGGVALILGSGILVGQALGVVLLVVALLVRPRIGSAPEGALRRDEAPELYRLVDEIAGRVGAPAIGAIAVRPVWNAGTYRYGVRQRHALILGLPLWEALPADERVALLGHEVAHAVNGDTLNGVLAGNATDTLVHLGILVMPDRIWPETGDGFVDLAAVPANIVLLGISLVFLGFAGVLMTLTFRDGRRAEFYADRLAASVAGTDATLRLFGTLRKGRAFDRAAANVRSGFVEHGLWAELAHQVEITPDSEVERLRRAERILGSRLDHTHPPPYQREELLRASPSSTPALVVDPERAMRVDRELTPVRERLDRRIRTFEVEPDEAI